LDKNRISSLKTALFIKNQPDKQLEMAWKADF